MNETNVDSIACGDYFKSSSARIQLRRFQDTIGTVASILNGKVQGMISICIPLFNEQDNIRSLYINLIATLGGMGENYEIIFVNDGSDDKTEETLNDLDKADQNITVIHFSRNYGQTSAMMAGMNHASGDVIISMDGDNQNDPVDIPLLLNKINEGFDVVCGWRKDRKDSLLSRIFPSIAANWLISLISGVKLHDYGCSLKAFRKEVIKEMKLYGEMHRFIPIYASWFGAKVTEIVVRHHPRIAGNSNYGISRIWPVLFRLFGGFGVVSFLLSSLCFFAMVYCKYWGGKTFLETPLPTLTVFFLVGFMAIFMGFIAETLMRIYHESQGRVPYVIKETIKKS